MADRTTGRKRPLFTLSQGDSARDATRDNDRDAGREDSLGPLNRAERLSRDERVDRVGREERVERIGREDRPAPEARRSRAAAEGEAHPVRIVDIDVPFSSIAYLFIKLLIVLIPFIAALGLAMRFVWKLAAG